MTPITWKAACAAVLIVELGCLLFWAAAHGGGEALYQLGRLARRAGQPELAAAVHRASAKLYQAGVRIVAWTDPADAWLERKRTAQS